MLHAFYSVLSRLSHSVLIMLKSGLWWGQSITHNVPLCVFLSRYTVCILHWQSVGDHQIRCGSVVFHVVLHSSNFCSPLHMTEDAHCFTSFLIRSIHIDTFYFFILIWIVTPEELLPLILGLFFMWFGIPQSFLFVSLLFFPQSLTSHIASVIHC